MKVKYPDDANTPGERTAVCYRLLELLRLDHNITGKKFKEGRISPQDWDNFKRKWNPKQNAVIDGVLEQRRLLKDDDSLGVSIDNNIEV